MTDPDRIIQEFYEADHAYRSKLIEALARDELATLPKDVREARAAAEATQEAAALLEKRIAFEQMEAAFKERWIASHEDMYGVRSAARQ